MSLNQTPSSERVQIGFFGCRNAGKSSLVNGVTGQDLAVVSEIRGTTTDPVIKAMELLPIGPVVIIDTPGYDDEGMLGGLRIRRTKQVLNRTDIAVLVLDAGVLERGSLRQDEAELLRLFSEKNIPTLIAVNKADLLAEDRAILLERVLPLEWQDKACFVSTVSGEGIHELKERLGKLAPAEDPSHRLVGDLIKRNDVLVLVCPIDESAPKGRLILPQQMMIRDILDAGAAALVTTEHELPAALQSLSAPPAMVITDSQAFKVVSEIVPQEVPLTSFSILMARYRGFLDAAVEGASALRTLPSGSRILMAEGCTHHRQCEDIGTVKIPKLIRKVTGRDFQFDYTSGREFPEDLSPYSLVIHCGACMNTDRDVQYRMRCSLDQGVPFTNYGITIACLTGVLERSLRIFPKLHSLI